MKKIFTHLTGIVFLMAILLSGGCKSADDPGRLTPDPERVTIYLKAYEDGNEMKLLMYDSQNSEETEAEVHVTLVDHGTRVVWRKADDSGIRSIKKVSPKIENGPIFPGKAKSILGIKYRIKVRDEAQESSDEVTSDKERGITEEYLIEWKDRKYNEDRTTDPYLRIDSD